MMAGPGLPDAQRPRPPGEARVRDPAARDQDAVAFRRGRFAERVRREWNVVPASALEAARRPDGTYDAGALAQAVQARVGGQAQAIQSRLAEFAALEAEGANAAPDALVRPGTGA